MNERNPLFRDSVGDYSWEVGRDVNCREFGTEEDFIVDRGVGVFP